MYKLNSIIENEYINMLIGSFERSPVQLNNPHETDAEIIQINDSKLAVTTDSISEEISTDLYDDPYLIGWMIVTVNMSDLAAVGASPLGILISEIIPREFEEDKTKELQRGISDSCKFYNTFVLGGDTNEGKALILSGTAIGIIKNEKPITRLGCKAGDILYSTGKPGIGNAYAISKLISRTDSAISYKPVARIYESGLLCKYATCCMDTSDGLISTLDQLMRLNNAGFKLCKDWENVIDDKALKAANGAGLPPWLLFAGQHGDFELIFTIPQNLNKQFLDEALLNGFQPIELGKVIPQQEINISIYGNTHSLDSTLTRNLSFQNNGDINHYIKMLLEYNSQLKMNLA
jgi:thiamine-monophosphate kinase